jgi:hypothetical protein
LNGKFHNPGGNVTRIIGMTTLLLGVAGYAFAGAVVAVPEIDGSTATAAVALLSGGILVLRGRRKK